MFKSIFSGRRPAVVSEVRGTPRNFYPLPISFLISQGPLLSQLAKGIAILWTKSAQSTEIENTESAAGKQSSVRYNPPAAAELKAQADLREKGVAMVVEAIANPSMAIALGEAVALSLADEHPEPLSSAEKQELIKGMTTADLAEVISGIIQANKESLSPFLARAKAAAAESPEGVTPLRAVPSGKTSSS